MLSITGLHWNFFSGDFDKNELLELNEWWIGQLSKSIFRSERNYLFLNKHDMERTVSEKNTKAQILEAYEKLLKKVEEKSNDNPREVQQRTENTQTLIKASEASGEAIINEIGRIKAAFTSSLETVASELTEERKKLETIQNAISIEEKRLDDLYGLSATADSFSALLLAQKEQKEQFEQETAARKEQLTLQIAETRAQWEKETRAHDENLKAEKETISKLRKREEEEYTYATQQKRKQEQDEYNQKKIRQDNELKEQRLLFEKEFAEREKSLLESENELESLRSASERFPAQLAKASQNARTETETRLQTIYKYERELQSKETQGLLNLKDQQVKSLEAKIKEMEVQLKEAASKADNSEKTVKDIALKAIESSGKMQVIERERVKE